MRCVPLLLLTVVAASVSAAGPAPVRSLAIPNAGFEQGKAGAAPPQWRNGIGSGSAPVQASSAYRTLIDAKQPYRGQKSARLELVGSKVPSDEFGSLVSSIDASSLRGRRVRLSAAVRSNAPKAELVGLWLRVDRPDARHGFFDNMGDRPIRDSHWARYTIEGDVSADATRIAFGAVLAGAGQMWLDDFRIEDVGPAKAPVKVTPTQYLEHAIAMLRQNHINTRTANWDQLIAKARQETATAVEVADTYPAIREIIKALGEHHTFLLPPGAMTAKAVGANSGNTGILLPTSSLVGGHFGLVRLPGFIGNDEQTGGYITALRTGLQSLDRQGVCGWIVDLREDRGGNMWPMLVGLDPLLGKAPFGAFRSPSGKLTYWVRREGIIREAADLTDATPAFELSNATAPIAVLLGPHTASSGEMTAIAFIGRSGVRTFGTPSAGYTTANVPYPLEDGAMLAVTTAYVRDRTGHEYHDAITPDQASDEGQAEAAALNWLSNQPCH